MSTPTETCWTITYTHHENVTGQLIDDIITTAFEGGIHYWCKEVIVVGDDYHGAKFASDVVSRGGTLNLVEEETGQHHVLGIENMLEGIKSWCLHFDKTVSMLNDDFDAGDADAIVQLALFGDVVYG